MHDRRVDWQVCLALVTALWTLASSAGAQDWAMSVALPAGEEATPLFNGRNLDGWEGQTDKYFSVADGMIRAANDEPVPASTYLFTKREYRNFRLLLEVKQTRSPRHSTMHSAVAALGEKSAEGDDPYGFRGPLLMFCNDWGVWDAHRRDRVFPAGHEGVWLWDGELVGEWNQIEILVLGERLRMVANGRLVMDFRDDPEMLKACPIGLQLHGNQEPQEYHFRGLLVVANPTDALATLKP
jgi:hypothetical protein